MVLGLFGVAAALVCVRLGIWQLDRLDQRRTANAAIVAAKGQVPVELTSLTPSDAVEIPYRPVTVRGTYDGANELILYGRSLGGVNGNHVLTPLEPTDGGPLIVVDRGWVPIEMDAPPLEEAPASEGEVEVAGTLQSPDAEGGGALDSTTVSRIDLTQIEATLGRPVFPMVLVARSQDPPPAGDLPRPVPLPDLGEGPHLSYALQWFAFAAIALVGTVVLAWREPRRDGIEEPGSSEE